MTGIKQRNAAEKSEQEDVIEYAEMLSLNRNTIPFQVIQHHPGVYRVLRMSGVWSLECGSR